MCCIFVHSIRVCRDIGRFLKCLIWCLLHSWMSTVGRISKLSLLKKWMMKSYCYSFKRKLNYSNILINITKNYSKLSVEEPCFRTNGPPRPKRYHGHTENWRETMIALCCVVWLRLPDAQWITSLHNLPNPQFPNNP